MLFISIKQEKTYFFAKYYVFSFNSLPFVSNTIRIRLEFSHLYFSCITKMPPSTRNTNGYRKESGSQSLISRNHFFFVFALTVSAFITNGILRNDAFSENLKDSDKKHFKVLLEVISSGMSLPKNSLILRSFRL